MAPETSLSCSCCVSPRVRSHRRFRSRGADYVREYGMNWMSVSTKRQCNRALVSPSISSTTLGLRLASPVVCRASTPPLPTSASTALECACVLHQCSEEEGISRYAPFAVLQLRLRESTRTETYPPRSPRFCALLLLACLGLTTSALGMRGPRLVKVFRALLIHHAAHHIKRVIRE